jgi:two-component system, cell cycle sensor histidine kinase and response regulator CckA
MALLRNVSTTGAQPMPPTEDVRADAPRHGWLTDDLLNALPTPFAIEQGPPGDGHIIYTNDAWVALLATTRAALAGQPTPSILALLGADPADAAPAPTARRFLLRDATPAAARAPRWLEPRVTPLPGASARRGLTLLDVTAEQNAAEERRLLGQFMHDLVTAHTGDGRLTYASPSAKTMLGLTPAELCAQPIHRLLHRDELRTAHGLYVMLLEGRGAQTFIHRLRHREGHWIWTETTARLRITTQGEREIVATSHDITRRREAERNLQTAHSLLHSIFGAAPLGLCLVEGEGTILLANATCAKLLGKTDVDLTGGPITEHLPTELWNRLRAPDATMPQACQLAGGQPPQSARHIEAVLSPVPRAQGGWRLLTLHDTSARHQMEHRLRESRHLEGLASLAAGVAHEFNNALSVVLGYGSILNDAVGDLARLGEYSREIVQAARRGAEIVRQLQVFANIHEFAPNATEAHALLRQAVAESRAEWPLNLTLNLDLSATHARLPLDSAQVVLAVRHILRNSRDAIAGAGAITVRTTDDRRTLPGAPDGSAPTPGLLVAVADTGCGIAPAMRRRLFEPFVSQEQGKLRRGLGLSVVYGVVRAHGGVIDVESEPGQGTTVRLFFPHDPAHPPMLSAAHPSPVGSAPRPAPTALAGPPGILVAEDEAAIASLWRNLLTRDGWTVWIARDGREAIELFAQHHARIAALFTDIGLPDIDGWELARHLRQQRADLPIITSSGSFEPGDRNQSGLAEPLLMLPKPLSPSAFRASLQRLGLAARAGLPRA